MTNPNGVNFNEYADAWAQMMLTIWSEKMTALDVNDTSALQQSLKTEVIRQSGRDVSKINHFFNYYGIYVAKGVGKGYKRGNGGDLTFTPKRVAKPWFSGKYWYSKNKLLSKMMESTGNNYLISISNILTGKK